MRCAVYLCMTLTLLSASFGCEPETFVCFVAGTVIETPGGPVPIEHLKAGDEVASVDPTSGVSSVALVHSVETARVSTYLAVSTSDGGQVSVTEHHPFWSTSDSGFRAIGKLGAGDIVSRWTDGALSSGSIVEVDEVRQLTTVYHLVVDREPHTFTANGYMVHNKLQPPPSISGNVRLRGTRRDASGVELGSIVIDDASGVNVQLFLGSKLIMLAATVDGRYTFVGTPPGTYRLYSWVTPTSGDSTSFFSVGIGNVQVTDTLTLSSMDSLFTRPNPAPADSLSSLTFTVAQSGVVQLDIIAPDSTVVRNLVSEFFAVGGHVARWDGTDNDSLVVAPGPYWAVYTSGGIFKNELIVRE